MKEKALQAKDPGLDDDSRAKINTEFKQLRDQIKSIVNSATFNGRNAIKGDVISALANSDGTDSISLAGHNLSLGGGEIAISASQQILTAADASAAFDAITRSINAVSTALTDFGAGSKRFEMQRKFVGRLSDTIETGIGNLVDANLAEEAMKLQALQIKQQLAIQALSIANQFPRMILQLFQ